MRERPLALSTHSRVQQSFCIRERPLALSTHSRVQQTFLFLLVAMSSSSAAIF